MDIDESKFETFKVVLIGETGVGKTSIITQFIEQVFQEEQTATTGGTFSTRTIKCSDGRILKFEIWDTAGEERYRSITKMFYKDANAAILVYDITRKDSFEELQNYWVSQLGEESSSDSLILAIAANKSDLFDKEEVPEEMVREYAQQIGALFMLTSAKNTSGINELFIEIAKKYTGVDCTLASREEIDDANQFGNKRKDSVRINEANNNKPKKKGCC